MPLDADRPRVKVGSSARRAWHAAGSDRDGTRATSIAAQKESLRDEPAGGLRTAKNRMNSQLEGATRRYEDAARAMFTTVSPQSPLPPTQ